MRTVSAVVAFAFTSVAALAQPAPVPPVPAPTAVEGEPPFLKSGKDVSRPLTPVGPDTPPATPKTDPPVEPKPEPKVAESKSEVNVEVNIGTPAGAPRGPLGPGWTSVELLYWWPMRQPVPPLVAGMRSGAPPVAGDPATRLLVGGHSVGSQPHAGGRFTTGSPLNGDQTFGYEITYLFLGTRTFRERVSDLGGGGVRSFGLPYTNAVTGAPEFLVLAQPGATNARLTVSTSTRVQGWEVSGVASLYADEHFKLRAVGGWRYFQVHEGLRVEQMQMRFADLPGVVRTADQFDAHNRFHGGQLGLHADARRGIVFCEMTAKVAFGQNYEVVKTEGMSILQSPVFGGVSTSPFGGS
ncbi:MAG: BBP7 family outer membrane beta-barrel protein, partial [Gemmataceae bacterium]|nr:BBP7 family outer membrane beta-barrel protein [Gemmataceae bacterium]